MTGNGHPAHDGKPAPEPAAPVRIILTLEGLDISVQADGVLPSQLYLAAWYLEAIAREVRAGTVARQALGGLTAAPGGLVEELRRQGLV